MVVPIVTVCDEWLESGDRTKKRCPEQVGIPDNASHFRDAGAISFKQLEFAFIGSGQLDPVTGKQCQEIFAVDMRFHFPHLPDVDYG